MDPGSEGLKSMDPRAVPHLRALGRIRAVPRLRALGRPGESAREPLPPRAGKAGVVAESPSHGIPASGL